MHLYLPKRHTTLEVGNMTTQHLAKPFKDTRVRNRCDRWVKDPRVKTIQPELVKRVVVKVLADLSVRTDTLAVGRPTRTTKILIEAALLHEAELTNSYFFILLQRELCRFRGVRSPHSKLSAANEVGYLLFTYAP